MLENKEYVDLILSPAYTHRTYYMGLVDENNKVNFYDGQFASSIRPAGNSSSFAPRIICSTSPNTWNRGATSSSATSKSIGWKGFEDGAGSGVYAVAPLARLNASGRHGHAQGTGRIRTVLRDARRQAGPLHVGHALGAAGRNALGGRNDGTDLAADEELIGPDIRNLPTETPEEGIGVVEAPRGTLFHHYQTDERGVITKANLIVATQNNAARIAMSVDSAAKGVIRNGQVDDGILNKVEMAFRAYDPCHACATHALNGPMPLEILVYNRQRQLLHRVRADR